MPRILVIEDEKAARAAIIAALHKAGYKDVDGASNGDELYATFVKSCSNGRPYQAILCDYYLKDEYGQTTHNGRDMLKALHSEGRETTPFIGGSSDIQMWKSLAVHDPHLYPIAKVYEVGGFRWDAPNVLAKLTELGILP